MPAPPLGLTARATVARIVDGDTLDVTVHWPLRIRLSDCWAPETRGEETQRGLAAKAHLEKLAPAGSLITFAIDSKRANGLGDLLTFGRVVANVWTNPAGDSLSQMMVGDGFAGFKKGGAGS